MKKHFYNTLASAVVLALTACGGSSDGGSQNAAKGTLVLDTAVLADQYSSVVTDTLPDSGLTVERWEYNFTESQRSFASTGEEYFEIDLLKGVEPSKSGKPLEVKNIEYFWRGPDCSDTLLAAVNYPEYCDEILAHFNVEAGEQILFNLVQDIREYQNLPRITDPEYGFSFTQNTLRVAPYEFMPLLRDTETAVLNFRYLVTDGENEVVRYLKVTVNGEDSAPTWVVYDGNEPTDTPYEMPHTFGSEKSDAQAFDFMYGYYDKDIAKNREMMLKDGDLSKKYNRDNTYRIEQIGVVGPPTVKPIDTDIEFSADDLNAFVNVITTQDPTFEQLSSYNVVINPKRLANYLDNGDRVDFDITVTFTDGHNEVDRTMRYTLFGASEGNNSPVFIEEKFNANVSTNSSNSIFLNLLDGVLEPDGDSMEPVDLQASGSAFGGVIDPVSGSLLIDPAYFTYLKEGETEEVTYTYKITDGEFTTDERTYVVTITGSDNNMLGARGDFESGALDNNIVYQWAPSGADSLAVSSDITLPGSDYSLHSKEGSVFFRIEADAIDGTLKQGDLFYFSYYLNTQHPWSTTTCYFNKNGTYNGADHLYITSTQNAGAAKGSWTERTTTLEANEFFDGNKTFGVTCLGGADHYFDEFSIVKIDTNNRSLIKNSGFSNGLSTGWSSGADSIEVNAAASSNANPSAPNQFGLEVKNTDGWTTLVYSDIPKGAIKNGMRYVVEFDYQNPGYDKDTNSAKRIKAFLKSGNETVRKIVYDGPTSATKWDKKRLHLNTISLGHDVEGALVSDPNYDWAAAEDVTLHIEIPPNAHYRFDNVRLYPVPQR
ncbi:hypothetical protein [Gayadomonas joobiniege]|uniref:hypothetical protein n=1 Tax=Gayadomonas joobiniege TaxID=1234606 RepID=UPI000366598D|nr:hypothetical protein [Gayadomonas joobiniege]